MLPCYHIFCTPGREGEILTSSHFMECFRVGFSSKCFLDPVKGSFDRLQWKGQLRGKKHILRRLSSIIQNLSSFSNTNTTQNVPLSKDPDPPPAKIFQTKIPWLSRSWCWFASSPPGLKLDPMEKNLSQYFSLYKAPTTKILIYKFTWKSFWRFLPLFDIKHSLTWHWCRFVLKYFTSRETEVDGCLFLFIITQNSL